MQFPPSQPNPRARRDTRPEAARQIDEHQSTGADNPRQRTALDNSRAVPPEYLEMHPDGRLQVSQDIRQLLGLQSNRVDLNADTDEAEDDEIVDSDTPRIALKSAFAEPSRGLPAINPNVPPSSYRFLSMSLPALLQEVALRAIGEGPPDPVAPQQSANAPESRRLGDMIWALQYQPDRQHDAQLLRNAGQALTDFFPVYRRLVADVRRRRPDLVSLMPEWTAELVREPLRKALEMPLGPDDEPLRDATRSGELRERVERPYDVHVAELDARLAERRRFGELPLLALLEEAAQRAIGNGPPDTRPPTDAAASPEAFRIGQMTRVLQAEPGRANDAIHLRNAGRLLSGFFRELRALVPDIKNRRPDLESHLASWSADLARPVLQRALNAPGVLDAAYRVDEALAWKFSNSCRRPIATYITALERRALAHQDQQFLDGFAPFFQRMTRPRVAGSFLENSLRGAGVNEAEDADVKDLLSGSIVFQCTEAQLAENLQRVPAGAMHQEVRQIQIPGDDPWLETNWLARYPQRPDGNSIRDVAWQGPDGITFRVFVTERSGVHSFSANEGVTWRPTGGPGGAVAEAARADRWAAFLAGRRSDVRAAQGR